MRNILNAWIRILNCKFTSPRTHKHLFSFLNIYILYINKRFGCEQCRGKAHEGEQIILNVKRGGQIETTYIELMYSVPATEKKKRRPHTS